MGDLLEVIIKEHVWFEEFTLPFTENRRYEVMTRFNYDKEFGIQWNVDSVKSLDPSISFALEGQEVNDPSYIDELEFLAVRLEYMTETEQSVFKTIIETEQPTSLRHIINLSYNLDCYDDINSGRQKGHPYVEVYSGDSIFPDPAFDKQAFIVLRIHASDRRHEPNMYSLALPLSPDRYHMAQSALKEDLDLCRYTQCGGSFGELFDYIPVGTKLSEMNRFVVLLKNGILDGTKETSNKMMAVLEAECPRTIAETANVVRHLEDYQVLEESIKTPEAFIQSIAGHDQGFRANECIAGPADWEVHGKRLMEEYGAVLTGHGIVVSQRWKCDKLDEEYVITKLSVSLKGHFWYENYYYDEPMSQRELVPYINDIKESIVCYEQYDQLAAYFNNKLLGRRIESLIPDAEVADGRVWWILEVKSHGALTSVELDVIQSEWKNQCIDGWGKEFETFCITEEDEGELFVRLNSRVSSITITAEQELKGNNEQEEEMQIGIAL